MPSSLPDGWRPLRVDDAPAIARAAAEDEAAYGHSGTTGPDDVLTWWQRADLEHNSWLLEEVGMPVAFGWLELHTGHGIAVGAVARGAKGRGLGTRVLNLSERRAAELEVGSLRQIALGGDEPARALLEGLGYREVRRYFQMAIALDSELAAPELPAGLEIDTLREAEERAFHAVSGETFADEWGFHPLSFDEWWTMRRDEDKSLWFVVRDGDEIAGLARCAPGYGGGYVGLLGVRKPWRRRGLGRALLLHAFREFRRRGFERASLGVDSENPTGATRLYEAVGMHVESMFVTFEKALT